MKSNYCFLRDVGHLVPGSFIYTVRVGSSLREFAKKRLVEEFCRDNGLYFEKWSDEVDSLILEKEHQYRKNGNVFASCFFREVVDIKDFYQMLIDDSFDAFEAKHVCTPFEIWCECHDVPEYIQKMNGVRVTLHANPHKSKNLSFSKKVERVQAAACLTCILILLLVDAFISHIFNFTF